MSEHLRNNGHQWVDGEVCMVWDKFHEEPVRFTKYGGVYGTRDEALEHVTGRTGWESRLVILIVPAILAYKLP